MAVLTCTPDLVGNPARRPPPLPRRGLSPAPTPSMCSQDSSTKMSSGTRHQSPLFTSHPRILERAAEHPSPKSVPRLGQKSKHASRVDRMGHGSESNTARRRLSTPRALRSGPIVWPCSLVYSPNTWFFQAPRLSPRDLFPESQNNIQWLWYQVHLSLGTKMSSECGDLAPGLICTRSHGKNQKNTRKIQKIPKKMPEQ